jgi:hypothetical protein
MSFWTELPVPTERELLVGFYDLTGYMRFSDKAEPQELLVTMAGYFASHRARSTYDSLIPVLKLPTLRLDRNRRATSPQPYPRSTPCRC